MIDYSENSLIEQPAIALFGELGWQTINCFHEFEEAGGSPLGRETAAEVVLVSRLRPALEKLNRELPKEAIDLAVEELVRDRSTVTTVQANQEIYQLLKDGIKVDLSHALTPTLSRRERENVVSGDEIVRVKIIDWDNPANNDFFLASQFWISGEIYKRRADLVGFVNGLPLVFIELKAVHKRLENAYNDNLRDYKSAIPQIFWYNAFIILSNGSESRIGSLTDGWEHFVEWKRINDEGEKGVVSLETMIRGTCEPARLLDLVENFLLYEKTKGGLIKLVPRNHQVLGVNRAIEAVKQIKENRGRLGVFWHTQGSGKSYSMVRFSQKVLRKLPGNWTFMIVTDRQELDRQIYKNFVNTGAITEEEVQAESVQHLRRLLTEDHRYVFTLIHKFRTERGEPHPVLSERSDIIVITDEAHRSQYDTLALNMRTALSNAAFIAFTGTPLIVGEEKTRQVFGDYVSIYDFKQSVDDNATVPLYYENRIPELQLRNEDLNEDMERLLEEAELSEEQERKLEREFARKYHLITREDRLETIAKDVVAHFMRRGFQGKAMVVSIDKATAVRMYDKAKKYWPEEIQKLREELLKVPEEEREELKERIRFLEETDMAVVVSQSQNEIEEMRAKGLDIEPHRRRIVTEDLDSKFKDPNDPFRLVFVCAMWMTGFDVPSCSTIYLDKPMKNHTLMQTIARANRVFRDKVNGLIVDYGGVFRNLQKALAIYGAGTGEGKMPVQDKLRLVEELRRALGEAVKFCKEHGVDLEKIQQAEGFERVKLLDDAVDAILVNDESKKRFLSLAYYTNKLLKAVLPDKSAREFSSQCHLLRVLAQKIFSLAPPVDISHVMREVEDLLNHSVAAESYVIREPQAPYGRDRLVDLSQIDFEALRRRFEKGRKRIEIEKLRSEIEVRLRRLIHLNRMRIDFQEKFQRLIDEYNAGSLNIEEFFRQLVVFTKELSEEEKRGISENLSEEELAIFDILTKPEMKMSEKEKQQVKNVARELLETLKGEKLVLDWRKKQQSRADVRVAIEKILDRGLPPVYDRVLFGRKSEALYQHIYDSYFGAGKSIYISMN
jgi:type I restriction enzyme R subunit